MDALLSDCIVHGTAAPHHLRSRFLASLHGGRTGSKSLTRQQIPRQRRPSKDSSMANQKNKKYVMLPPRRSSQMIESTKPILIPSDIHPSHRRSDAILITLSTAPGRLLAWFLEYQLSVIELMIVSGRRKLTWTCT